MWTTEIKRKKMIKSLIRRLRKAYVYTRVKLLTKQVSTNVMAYLASTLLLLFASIFNAFGQELSQQDSKELNQQDNRELVQDDNNLVLTEEQYLQLVKTQHPVFRQAFLLRTRAEAEQLKARGAFDPKLFGDVEQKSYDQKNYFTLGEGGVK